MCAAASFEGGRVAESHSGASGAVTCNDGWTSVRSSLPCVGKPAAFSPGIASACKRCDATGRPLPFNVP